MKKNIIALAAVLLAVLYSCNSKQSLNSLEASSEQTAAVYADTAVTEKIIKTAEMRFRVKNARQTKMAITAHLLQIGGSLVESNLSNEVNKSEKTKYSADSLLEIVSYKTEGNIIARVPSKDLDAFTDFVAQRASFVDRQSLKFDDQSLAYWGGSMKANNLSQAVSSLNKQTKVTTGQINTTRATKDNLVDQKISNRYIDNQVKYSTISLSFYQDNTIAKTIISNDTLSDYRPGFFKRAALNFSAGWSIFKEFLLIIVNLWMFLLAGAAIYFAWIYLRNRKALHS